MSFHAPLGDASVCKDAVFAAGFLAESMEHWEPGAVSSPFLIPRGHCSYLLLGAVKEAQRS